MSPRSWQDRAEDILSCVRNIRDYTEGMSFDAFLDDSKTICAVAFEFTTMGEASRGIPMDVQKQFPDVPWGRMQGIRNVLVPERVFPPGRGNPVGSQSERYSTLDHCAGKDHTNQSLD